MNAALIRKAKTEPDAFGTLYEELYDPLYRFVYLRVHDQALCQDVVSQVWEKTLTHLRYLESDLPEVFRGWIFTVARNTIAEHFRKSGHQAQALPKDWDPPAKEDTAQASKDQELTIAVQNALSGLPPQVREIVEYKLFGDLKNKEIARLMDQSEQMVAVYLSRGMKQLRTRLSSYLT